MTTQKKLAVVTGGAGFVGSHLCERLHALGWRVISLDNYFTGTRENHVPGVEYRVGHTKDIAVLVPETPDILFHLGEYARVEQSVLEPEVVRFLNTIGTDGVIAFWRSKKCKLIYAGSSTKFGDSGETRYTSPYARTKAENSERIRDIGEKESLPYAVTYFYNVYGPRERSGVYGTVIEHFKRMYLSGAPCAIVAPGTQVRNFTHVLDIVDGLVAVGERGMGDEFGLGNLRAYSIVEVADMFGFKENRVMFPPREGNRLTSALNTDKANALGWRAERELPEYIRLFTDEHSHGASRDKRVLVFSTTFTPTVGLAEDSFIALARALPSVHFDVVTTHFTGSAKHTPSPASNITIHRVGFGMVADKFLLPLLGVVKGISLAKQHSYLFTWGLMASYAGLASALFKSIHRSPLLLTLADQSFETLSPLHQLLFSLMVSRADQVYGTNHSQETDAARFSRVALPRRSLGGGDAFANALRFAYADTIRKGNT
ncbi:MAG: NAD-dependent epimerase/dehydratase family protein [Patescibacteria group bacterium]